MIELAARLDCRPRVGIPEVLTIQGVKSGGMRRLIDRVLPGAVVCHCTIRACPHFGLNALPLASRRSLSSRPLLHHLLELPIVLGLHLLEGGLLVARQRVCHSGFAFMISAGS